MKKILLILSAGKISNKFSHVKPLFDNPGLLPVNSKSCIRLIINFYIENCIDLDKIIIVSDSDGSNILKEEFSEIELIQVINIKSTKGVNDTLQKSLEFIPMGVECIINISTTIPSLIPSLNQVLIGNKRAMFNNFSGINFINNEKKFLFKKGDNNLRRGYPFTGVFSVKSDNLIKAFRHSNKIKKDDLLYVIESLSELLKISFKKTPWYDIGHEVNYFESRISYMVSRSFNKMKLNSNGVLKKSSSETIKLKNEVNFILDVPNQLKIYFPRVFDFKNHRFNSSVELEFYGYPNLSEYQLYWDLDELTWRKIFAKIEQILKSFNQKRHFFNKSDYLDFMFTKVENRLNDFFYLVPEFSNSETLFINNLEYYNWPSIKEGVKTKIESLYNVNFFTIMHGDLCFNNILYDRVGNNIKLIDARGSYGPHAGIYGDFRYDLAKFLHSSIYNYDYLVNDLFILEESENGFHLNFKLRRNHDLLKKLSINLINKFNCDFSDLSFMVGLLFISMCPMHSDDPLRQKAMYLHGIEILNKNLD